MTRRSWALLLGVLVSLGAVGLALTQVDVSQLGDSLSRARYIYILPSFAVFLLGLLARAYRWQYLLDQPITLRSSFSINSIAYLLNSLLPLRAGEVARVLLSARTEPPIPVVQSTSLIVVERLLDLLFVVILLALGLGMGGVLPTEVRAAAFVSAPVALLALLLLTLLAYRPAWAEVVTRLFESRIPFLARELHHIMSALALLRRPAQFARVLLWTAIGWLCTIAATVVLMLVFFERVDWLTTCLVTGALAFAAALPAAPGNIGTYELAVLVVLRAAGYDENVAFVFGVLLHAVDVGVYLLAGISGLLHLGLNLSQFSRELAR
ncbi:MAG: flippase-like domain-containing protein [Anaerolineae bacterium]|nr:flippase-like domain-containing protein [Anaerolineae bacterium]